MVRQLHASRLDKPLRLNGAVKTAEAQQGGISLQSLQVTSQFMSRVMSHALMRSARGGAAMRVAAIDSAR
jgi:hypothetical protein